MGDSDSLYNSVVWEGGCLRPVVTATFGLGQAQQ